MHGGKTPKGLDSPNYKHGLYSKYENPEARGHMEAAKRLSAIETLRQTIPVMAGLLSYWLDTQMVLDPGNYQATTALAGRLTRAVESYEKLTNPELRTGKLIVEHDFKDKNDGDLLNEIDDLHREAEAITRAAAEREGQA